MRQGWQRFNMDGMSGSHRMGSRVSLAITVGIGVALTGCSYGSRTEARIACQQWAKEGRLFRFKIWSADLTTPVKEGETTSRSCQTETATNQVIGWERIPPKGWNHLYQDVGMAGWNKSVVKRFRWPSR